MMRDTDKNRKMPGGKKVNSLSAVKLYGAVRPLMKFILTGAKTICLGSDVMVIGSGVRRHTRTM
mgnify:CR=1 FL=1